MSDMTRDEVRDKLGNIDQIRDIIFGAQLREYDNRLSKIESDALLAQQDTRDRIEKLRSTLEAELRSAVESLEKKLRSYNTANQEESSELRQQIDRVSKKFSSSLQALDEAVDRQFDATRNDLSDTKGKLQGEINALRDLVFEELERRLSQVQEKKASRDDLADTLFELGMRIKGAEFIPALKEVGDNPSAYEPIPLLATRKHAEEIAHPN